MSAEGSPTSVLLLAGRRDGFDPLAEADGAPHRAFLDIEGEPMVQRVLGVLLARPGIERVVVSIDRPELFDRYPALVSLRAEGRIEVLKSTASPSLSVREGLEAIDDWPVLVTTADHALLDHAMLDHFLSGWQKSDADVAVGLVPRRVIEARFPEARRTYLKFRDDHYSGANLFGFRNARALRVLDFWHRVEQHRKRPWRLVSAFGFWNLVLFLLRRLDLDTAMQRASKVFGVEARAIPMPMAEAAVDVDKADDLILVRRILADARAAG